MRFILTISLFLVFCSSSCSAREHTRLESYGDFYQLALPTAAILTSVLSEEAISKHSVVISMIEVQVLSNMIKYLTAVPRPRKPDGYVYKSHLSKATSSFPSAHTAAAAVGATYLIMNNKNLGVYQTVLIAGLVGISRVHAKAHFKSDVLAGALLGTSITVLNEFFKKNSYSQVFHTITEISLSPNSITLRF